MTQQEEHRNTETITITDANFDSIILKNSFVIIDFWASWCGPCLRISPIIDELAHELSDRAVFGKLDVDANPRIPSRFHVRSIPTVMIFKNGQPTDQLIGSAPKSLFRKKIVSSL
jgi:thioredoxin 1